MNWLTVMLGRESINVIRIALASSDMQSITSNCFGVAMDCAASYIFCSASGQAHASKPVSVGGMVAIVNATVFSWICCLSVDAAAIMISLTFDIRGAL